MEVCFIRHAKSILNEKGLLQGRLDCGLGQTGLAAAKEKAKTVDTDFDICFCSPLLRARQTADILFPTLPKIIDERIIERNLGAWQGTKWDEEKGTLLRGKTMPEGIESEQDVKDRVADFFVFLKENYSDQKVVVVAHAGVLHAVFRVLGQEVRTAENLEIVKVEI